MPSTSRPFAALTTAVEAIPPDHLLRAVRDAATARGAAQAQLFLADYDLVGLRPVTLPDEPEQAIVDINATVAGRCFATQTTIETNDGEGASFWVPVSERSARLGVLLVVGHAGGADDREFFEELGRHVGHLLTTSERYTDAYHRLRRRKEMSLAAEIQWSSLAPASFAVTGLAVAGHLEPAYDVGGDIFDYALNGGILEMCVIDAMGHGVEACLLATAALGQYRLARRHEYGLPATFELIDTTVRAVFGGERFVTAVLGHLDVATGHFTWCNAGHPAPLLIRGHRVVAELTSRPALPLGLGPCDAEIGELALQRGDRILTYTDGVVDTRPPGGGERFGEDRLREFVEQEAAAGQLTNETLRRLTTRLGEHRGGSLDDDATLMLVEWEGP